MQINTGYHEFRIAGLDSRMVEALWSFKPERADDHRVLPDGRIDLLMRFNLLGDDRILDARPVIAGPVQRYATVPAGPATGFLGIRFRPGWGAACLGLSAHGLRNSALIWAEAKAALGALAVPLLRAGSLDELQCRLIGTAQTLTGRQTSSPRHARVIHAVQLLESSGGRQSVVVLADEVGISVRTLHRDFTSVVGLSVKSFASIIRFQRAMRLLHGRPSMALAALAGECGYSDQAHMTRDFRYLGGFTPSVPPAAPIINLPL
ncbi:MAG TPA: helix-turn-helix domain-containing protein [Noviherbaspirillum sp.]|jgi:AraC-like DNA-binding protein|uniref:AraC family transcriptional regulator n=1 Tax=Noviherbaspirillum sp. TaxID=1926288 RepID=UPI002DDDAED2|nr:helix-turn-helix domain-containing protein [Noviherbaspirillum sp.]HEV2608875.1 helix-turn-helix domain-containing protein [Noviherbaspirillum sp.]